MVVRHDLPAALTDFESALADLTETHGRLMTLPDSLVKDNHLRRISWTLGQVATVQNLVFQLRAAMGGARRATKFALPQRAEEIAYYALRGGSALLAGVAFSARQFTDRAQNPEATGTLCDGIMNGVNWLALGRFVGMIEEGIRR